MVAPSAKRNVRCSAKGREEGEQRGWWQTGGGEDAWRVRGVLWWSWLLWGLWYSVGLTVGALSIFVFGWWSLFASVVFVLCVGFISGMLAISFSSTRLFLFKSTIM